MEKPWRVSDAITSNEEDFATEQEALAFADELLVETRKEAFQDGEWAEETGLLRVYHLTHSAQVSHKDENGAVDYAVLPAESSPLAELARLISLYANYREALTDMVALWERVHGTAIIGRPTVNKAKAALQAEKEGK